MRVVEPDFVFSPERRTYIVNVRVKAISLSFNSIALRKVKIVCNFGLSECYRVIHAKR